MEPCYSWRWAYQEAKVEFDDARKLAQSVGLDLTKEWNKGFILEELIDMLHYFLLLWKDGKRDDMRRILSEKGFGDKEIFYKVAQAI